MKFKRILAIALTAAMFLSTGTGVFAAKKSLEANTSTEERISEAKAFEQKSESVSKEKPSVPAKDAKAVTGKDAKAKNRKDARKGAPSKKTAPSRNTQSAYDDFYIEDDVLYYYIGSDENVIIPDGVNYIYAGAFADNDNIRTVTIPASVNDVDSSAFSGCLNLTDIIVDKDNDTYFSDDGVLYQWIDLDEDDTYIVFLEICPQGKENTFAVPDYVSIISDEAFKNCFDLTGITLPDSVVYIGERAFSGCICLKTLTIPASVIGLSSYICEYCVSLTSIKVDKQNTEYASADGILYNKDKSVLIECPAGKTGSVTIPGTVEIIDWYAFEYCTRITGVTIPSSVTEICTGAFKESGLTKVNIPTSVTSIDDFAFAYCADLASFTVDSKNKNFASASGVLYNKGKNILMAYPPAKTGSFVIPNSVTELGAASFAFADGLTSVVIPNTVTEIGECSFYGTDISEVSLPASVSVIRPSVFAYSNISRVAIPNTVTVIFDDAFEKCGYLDEVVIPKSVQCIESCAFYDTDPSKVYYTGSASQWNDILTIVYNDEEEQYEVTDEGYLAFDSDLTAPTCNYKGNSKLAFTKQPAGVSAKVGDKVTFQSLAKGDGLSYQWYYKKPGEVSWSKWGSHNTASTSGTVAASWQNMQLYCKATDMYGKTKNSNTITVKIPSAPIQITTQPKSQTIASASTVKFTVKATGKKLTYQWYYMKKGAKSWTKWSGKTSATLSFKTSGSWDGAQFYCLIKDSAKKTLNTYVAKLTVKAPELKITTQPANKTVKKGKTVTFSLKATGSSLKYQWYYKKKGAKSWTKWSGKTKASLSFKGSAAWNGAQFYCKVSDGSGKKVNSKTVKLTVKN